MLIEFTFENFLSFKDPSTLSMVAGAGKEFPGNVFQHRLRRATRTRPVPLLKCAAIYGPNAGGKTNLLKALSVMRTMVLHSSKDSQANEPMPVNPFLWHPKTPDQPCTMEVVFVQNDIRYRYGFSADAEQVEMEWLFAAPKGREAKFFIREAGNFEFGSGFGRTSGLEEKTRENALFLSVAAQFNNPVARELLMWFSSLQVVNADDLYNPRHSIAIMEREKNPDRLLEFVRLADHTISDMVFEEIDLIQSDIPQEVQKKIIGDLEKSGSKGQKVKVNKLVSFHHSYDDAGKRLAPVALDFENESKGTRRFFELAGMILFALDHGSALLIDELECSLHPKITRFIINTFHSSETNPKNAQLIFATHDIGLFSRKIFRRDQLWMIRKSDFGGSELYALSDFQVRPDASFDKDYMQGRFGAVPLVREPAEIFRRAGHRGERDTDYSEKGGNNGKG
ncbi:MAG: ATP-binding protein [Desulfobacterales bacterium]